MSLYLGTDRIDAGSAVSSDNKSITTNSLAQIQTVGVIDNNNSSTAIKTWTGTLNEYNALGTYNPDWLYYITDDYVAGGTAGGRNIGDIFYSARTDSALAGAVRCNGGTYVINDFSGAESIGTLLAGGKLPYISLADYATEIATNGVCGKFGWDGGNSTTFKVPTLNDVFLEASNSNNGSFISAGLPNITGQLGEMLHTELLSGAFYERNHIGDRTYTEGPFETGMVNLDASRSNAIYGNSTTVQPPSIKYSAFVQISLGETDSALETCTSVLADVSDMKDHRVIAYQEPTAENGYTWYRKYADGWCEQGGMYLFTSNNYSTYNLIIPMSNTSYTLTAVFNDIPASTTSVSGMNTGNYTTTTFEAKNDMTGSQKYFNWVVYGKYAQE